MAEEEAGMEPQDDTRDENEEREGGSEIFSAQKDAHTHMGGTVCVPSAPETSDSVSLPYPLVY